MLNELKASFVKRGIKPHLGLVEVLRCTRKTAQNKLNGITAFTVPEANTIIECLKSKGYSDEKINMAMFMEQSNNLQNTG